MSNCEHLIENALVSMQRAERENKDTYKAFQNEMNLSRNKSMLDEVSVTKEELWQIAQYILCSYPCINKGDWEY